MIITFILDPIKKLNPKDGTIALADAAHKMGHEVILVEGDDIVYEDEKIMAIYYKFPSLKKKEIARDMSESNIVMMRIDPPFDMNYIYHTYLLEKLLELNPKLKILNPPHILRSWNEKMSILKFPKLIPPTLISKKTDEILSFARNFPNGAILKPLNQKGGTGIDWLKPDDTHIEKMEKIEKLTRKEKKFIMAQEYLKEAVNGDKRITIINGEILHCILRVPKEGNFKGNISQGAVPYPSSPTKKELSAAREIGKALKKNGIFFAGLDFIGEKLTEINVTSPIVGFTIFPDSPEIIIKALTK